MAQQKPAGAAAWGLSVLRKWRIWRRQRLERRRKVWREYKCHFRHSYLVFWPFRTREAYKVILLGTNGRVRRKKSQWYCENQIQFVIGSVDVWHLCDRAKFVAQVTYSNVFGCHWKISPTRENGYIFQRKIHFSLFCLWYSVSLAGGAAPAPRGVAAQWGETIALDLQSGSCVHCQLFPARSSGGGGSAGACKQPLETTPTEANRATCLHFLNWAN